MARELAGYLLLAALVVALVGAVAWLRYNSRDRTYNRRMRREARAAQELRDGRADDR